MVDLQPGQVDLDRLRNGIGRNPHLDRMGHDIDRTAALDARRGFRIDHVHRNAHPDGGACTQALKIHMNRQILKRIELIIARDHAVLLALDLKLADRREEVAGEDFLLQFGMIERDMQRRLVVAIDHARNAPGPTLGARRAFTGARARARFELIDGRHGNILVSRNSGGQARRPQWRRARIEAAYSGAVA
jgi:hypothetical protein